MSATDHIRSMLDELMGTSRNGGRPRVEFDDPRVCKCFLLGCCPHDVLSGTRMSIGECPKIHDLGLKADYERANKSKNYYFEYDAIEQLRNFVNETDRRTEDEKRRLRETQEELSDEASVIAEQIHRQGEEIGTKLAKAEQLGAEGHVQESLELMKQVEELNKLKAAKEVEFRNCIPVSTYQQQKLRVCEICSAFLGIHDNDRRLADHFGGKLHLGYITIRQKLDELEKRVEDMRKQPVEEVSPRRERHSSSHRSRERENDRHHRQSTSRRSEHSSSSNKHKKHRHRDSRSRSNDRDRTRDRDSRKRDHGSSRSRHKSRSRS